MKRLTGIPHLAAVLLLAGCNFRQGTGLVPTLAPEQIIATAVQATADAMRLPFTDTPVPPTAVTPTLHPPTVTLTATPTATATPLPCNKAEFVTDVTIPDGEDITIFDTFTKTWRLRNVGTCTWTSEYRVVFDHGDQMLAPDSAPITSGTVAPGATVDVSVPMEGPGTAGTYKGYWRLRDAGGVLFGVGASGNVAFWVEIESISNLPAGPNFEVAFENLHACGSLQYATFRVGNSGGTGFESAQIGIKDLDTSGWLYTTGTNNSPFLGTASMCPPDSSNMGPGSVYFIAASIGASPPHGHDARLTLKLCTADNIAGDCVTKTLDFVIP
ncbi:MAG: NBR1-Ig-like domain-containing protein [Chloroflexi bacterium]|nr:NBR1-Ig-like domain-containing protein [Chloroflexota bacterium]